MFLNLNLDERQDLDTDAGLDFELDARLFMAFGTGQFRDFHRFDNPIIEMTCYFNRTYAFLAITHLFFLHSNEKFTGLCGARRNTIPSKRQVRLHSVAEFEIVLYDNVVQIPRDLLSVARLTRSQENFQRDEITLRP